MGRWEGYGVQRTIVRELSQWSDLSLSPWEKAWTVLVLVH